MLLLLHLERESAAVPAILQSDLKFVLQKCPVLLEEMFKIATLPRPPLGYGWLVSLEPSCLRPIAQASRQCLLIFVFVSSLI